MIKRDDLVKFIYDYFTQEEIEKAQKYDTFGSNGLQVKGDTNVNGVALGVSFNFELLKKAKEANCNFIITHHGLRLPPNPFYLNSLFTSQMKFLLSNNFSLMGFHFLLDSHSEIGNNAVVLKKLGAKLVKHFDEDWGWIGELPKPIKREECIKKLSSIYKCDPISFLYGKDEIQTIAIVSGGGTPYQYSDITDELQDGIDVCVTGEAKESTQGLCREAKINYVSFGHYNTEVIGVQALGKVIKKQFPDLPVKFINIPNSL